MKNNKVLMGFFLVLVFMMGACSPSASTTAGISVENGSQLSVTGSGRVFAVPDIAYINIGVRSQADTVADALAQNKQQAQAIKDVLIAAGTAEADIQTTSFNVYPQSDYDYQGNVTRTYFSVENTVYVTVRNLDTLGTTLDAVARSGANNIYGINFDVSDKSESQRTAQSLAVDSAKLQAEDLADAAGVELGDLISISTASTNYDPYYGYGMGGGGAVYEAVPISSGQIPINSSVTLVFEIK